MVYEWLLTSIIILLGLLAYLQRLKNSRICLFQDVVDLRFSISYAEGAQDEQPIPQSIAGLRLELLALSPEYRALRIDYIGFRRKRAVRLRAFSRMLLSRSAEGRVWEVSLVIEGSDLPEIRLNGLELYIKGYLLDKEQSKSAVYQKFIVFERPASLDLAQGRTFA